MFWNGMGYNRENDKRLEEMEILAKGDALFFQDKLEWLMDRWQRKWLSVLLYFFLAIAGIAVVFFIAQPGPTSMSRLSTEFLNHQPSLIFFSLNAIFLLTAWVVYFVWVYQKYGFDRAAYEKKARKEIKVQLALFHQRKKKAEMNHESA
jgi:hypothetical protein